MAFPRIGLGGVLTFDEKPAVRGMKRARNSLGRFTRTAGHTTSSVSRLGGAMRMLGGVLRTAGIVGGVVAIVSVFKKGISAAINFEQAMADLGAVARASTADMAAFESKAKEMGIVTEFSATQSAKAMKLLKMAGATTVEVIDGIKGVLDAASAGGVSYTESAQIVAGITRGMGREFSRAGNLADVLALASTKANVDMRELGEAFRYGMAKAKIMGIKTEELTAILGKLGDATLKGSIGGTALTNMLVKLSAPSEKAIKLMERWKIKLVDVHGKLLPISTIVEQFSKKLNRVQSATERSALSTTLFGVRGEKAYSALATAGKKSLDLLTSELHKASDGLGAAAEMAGRRLDTVRGQFKMLGATLEGWAIAMVGPGLDGLKKFVSKTTKGLNKVLLSLEGVREEQMKGLSITQAAAKLSKKYGRDNVNMAIMIGSAIGMISAAWNGLKWVVQQVWTAIDSTVGEFVRGFLTQIAPITQTFATMSETITTIYGTLFGWLEERNAAGLKSMRQGFKSFGWYVGKVISGIVKGLAFVFELLDKAIKESRSFIEKTTGATHEFFAKGLGAMGIISDETAARQMRMAKRAGKMVDDQRRHERDAFHKRLEELNRIGQVQTEVGAAPAKAAAEGARAAKAAAEAARRKPDFNFNIKNDVSLDGRKVGGALARHQQQIQERAGWKSTNWQPGRMVLEHGAMPATVSVGGGG